MDRGQRQNGPARGPQVVEADDAQVFRYAQAGLGRGPEHPEGQRVVAGEDGRRPDGQAQQLPRVPETLLGPEVADADEARRHRDARGLHRGPVAVHPGPAGEGLFGAGDDGDAPVPELEEVPGGRQAAVPVAGPDGRGGVRRLPVGVDEDERDAAAAQLAALGVGEDGVHLDDAGRAPVEDVLDPAVSRRLASVQLGQHQGEPVFARHVLDALDDLDVVGVPDPAEDELQHGRGPGGPLLPLVTVPADDVLDEGARLRGDVLAPVHHLGDRRDGDSGLRGDLRAGQRPGGGAFRGGVPVC